MYVVVVYFGFVVIRIFSILQRVCRGSQQVRYFTILTSTTVSPSAERDSRRTSREIETHRTVCVCVLYILLYIYVICSIYTAHYIIQLYIITHRAVCLCVLALSVCLDKH